jgi:N-methylhydantoinase A/oxoprolinase/acetone carboxylase beta subunit
MRGAAFQTAVKDAIVIDIGGTTTDVGSLQKGFPRQAATVVDVGGVRTNFRMPDVFSIGLGGGTIVAGQGEGLSVGPKSVGYRLGTEARVFGGSVLTCTDIAVAAGMADIGDKANVTDMDPSLVEQVRSRIADMLEAAVERSRISPEPLPVIAVGGGSILAPDRIGDLEVIRPENFAVANAVGAAIAQISGEVDRIFALDKKSREDCMAEAEDEARTAAIQAGAVEASLDTIEREDVPLAYLPGNATRIHVKVVGEMDGLDA